MTKLRDKVSAEEFSCVTPLDPAAIQQAGQTAAEAGKRTLQNSIKLAGSGSNHLDYLIKGPGGLVTQMAVRVSWSGADEQKHVNLSVGDFTTSRPVIFGFIPIGPASAPALTSLKRFSASLRSQLSQ